MKHKLTYVLATLIFAMALVATPTKAHASFDSYLTVDGGGGNDGGSSGTGVGGSTLTGPSNISPRWRGWFRVCHPSDQWLLHGPEIDSARDPVSLL